MENYGFMANKVTTLLEINSQLYCGELKFSSRGNWQARKNKSLFYRTSKNPPVFLPERELRTKNQLQH